MWACEKFARYLSGLDTFRLLTDHKPLVPLINKTDVDKAPLRGQRLLMRLMRFKPRAEYVAGKEMVVADTLSRCPNPSEKSDTEDEVEAYADAIKMPIPATDRQLKIIERATAEDAQLSDAIRLTRNGWPEYIKDVPDHLRSMYGARAEFSVADGLLLY